MSPTAGLVPKSGDGRYIKDANGDFICLAITSVEQARDAMAIDSRDMEEGELPRKSWIRLGKIFTLEKSLVVRSVGRINGSMLNTALRNLCGTIGYRV